jgi:hypothetical protein
MFNPNTNSQSVDASIASQTESQFVEVSGLMDDFISIEEFAPGSDWEDVLAASWGVPSPTPAPSRSAFSGFKDLGRSLRSIAHQIRVKKFEVA